MFDVFKEHGLVWEVFIPARRDKKGKWFGFARFRKVKEARLMAVKLENIIIRGKIFANLPKFNRRWEAKRGKIQMEEGQSVAKNAQDLSKKKKKLFETMNITYADVVGGQ
ncbi:unnamed protein product [Lathyrus sativus]|nr:unnamed protein product [Lathyrus sativus]